MVTAITSQAASPLINAQPNPQQNGPESHTDMGRAVYGGGGIAPDEVVKPGSITAAERHLRDVIFAFRSIW